MRASLHRSPLTRTISPHRALAWAAVLPLIAIMVFVGLTLKPKTHAAGTCSRTAAPFCWPTSVSPNGRYLLDQTGAPFQIVGDSPHTLFYELTEAQADAYFANRQQYGINSVWVELMCGTYIDCPQDYPNTATQDGIKPFTTSGTDIFTPNPAFFQRVDDMVNLAANHGITVFMDLSETGGWMSLIDQNGPTNNYALGQYIGNRYKNFPNVVYLSGNDFQTWNVPTDDANMQAIANGVKAADPNRIQTVELNYDTSSSLDDPGWANIIKLNFTYTYFPVYSQMLHSYNQTPTMPTFLGEANYENENLKPADPDIPYRERLQEYWAMTSGGTGQFYGNHDTWADGTNWAYESTHLDTPGVAQLKIMADFFNSIAWYDLVPDQSHTFLTAGYGTFATTGPNVGNDYTTAGRSADGSLGVIYVPTSHTITVDLAKMAGQVTARWFDPTTATYTGIGTLANSGTHQFTSPAAHADGRDDWVLLLQASGSADTTPPSAPTNLATTTVTGSSIGLSWTASTDNVGVDHYLIFRGGTAIGTSVNTTFTDNTVSAGSSYAYTIKAVDLAGNTSAASGTLNVTAPNTFTLGETNVLTGADNGNANLMLAQRAMLSQSGTVLSLSFYVATAAGKLRMGIYDASGPSAGPGSLKAQTAEITPVVGWNTANVTTQTPLAPGTYWLAYLPSDNNLAFWKADDATSSSVYCAVAYGAVPTSFCTPTTATPSHWSFYATLDAGTASPAPTPTPTPTPTSVLKVGDLNNDGQVNIFDLSILLSRWGTSDATSDLNHDGTVNIFDLSTLLSHWGL